MSNHLKPCPFCGGDASFNDHTDGCYFTVLRKLKSDPPADLSRVPDLIEAWNTRTAIQQAEAKTDEPVAWGWAIVDNKGLERRTRARIQDFFGSNQEAKSFSLEDVAREDREFAGCAPHRVITLFTHPAPGVPDGHVLVPIEPTEKMLLAYTGGALTEAGFRWCRHQWAAMLTAAQAQKP